MTTTILALDLGTTTGWALRGSDGHITSGSESFRPQRPAGGGAQIKGEDGCDQGVSPYLVQI